ncbi:MAG: oligosaccharide flippase family protein [Flavipsychrobacter sp.]|jgi:O-antigen/teichoic acid export membrane protein|nr:oligosaccharide flippase family protein [Flavipsychrobacter sp.]
MKGNGKLYPISRLIRNLNIRELAALKTTFISITNKVVSLLAIILYVRLTVPYLGNELFGVWMSLTSILTFLSIVSDLGLSVSMVNYVAISKTGKGNYTTQEITSSAFFFLFVMSITIGLIYWIFQQPIHENLTNGILSSQTLDEAYKGIEMLILLFLIGLPFISVEKTLEGLQLQYISISWVMVGNILSILATYWVAYFKLGLPYLVFSTIGTQTLIRIVCWITVFGGRFQIYRPSMDQLNFAATKKLIQAGFILFLLNLFNVIANFIDTIIITRKIGVMYVAQYAMFQKITNLSLFFWFYTSSFWPSFSEAHAINEKSWIQNKFHFLLKLNILLGTLFGVFLILFGKKIFLYWSGGNIESPSIIMIFSFSVYTLLYGVISCISLVFNSGYLIRNYIISFCVASAVSFVLKYLLLNPDTLDYYMLIPVLPYLIIFIIPCYRIIRKYVETGG